MSCGPPRFDSDSANLCLRSAALYTALKRASRSRRCATCFMTGARKTPRRTGYFSDTLKCSLTQGCVSTESHYLKHRQPAAPLAEPGNTRKKQDKLKIETLYATLITGAHYLFKINHRQEILCLRETVLLLNSYFTPACRIHLTF